MKKRHEQKLILLSLVLLLVFNIPFLFAYNSSDLVMGIPVLYLSIFIIWLLSVFISYYILKKFYE